MGSRSTKKFAAPSGGCNPKFDGPLSGQCHREQALRTRSPAQHAQLWPNLVFVPAVRQTSILVVFLTLPLILIPRISFNIAFHTN
jgi:hypothetical protein